MNKSNKSLILAVVISIKYNIFQIKIASLYFNCSNKIFRSLVVAGLQYLFRMLVYKCKLQLFKLVYCQTVADLVQQSNSDSLT